MKQKALILLTLILILSCSGKKEAESRLTLKDERVTINTTQYPYYIMAGGLSAGKALVNLIGNGTGGAIPPAQLTLANGFGLEEKRLLKPGKGKLLILGELLKIEANDPLVPYIWLNPEYYEKMMLLCTEELVALIPGEQDFFVKNYHWMKDSLRQTANEIRYESSLLSAGKIISYSPIFTTYLSFLGMKPAADENLEGLKAAVYSGEKEQVAAARLGIELLLFDPEGYLIKAENPAMLFRKNWKTISIGLERRP